MDKSHAPVALSAETKALLGRTPAVIEPGHTFESVTETIGVEGTAGASEFSSPRPAPR